MANKSINKFNVATIQQSGKVGTIRYYQRGGETFVRSAHNSVVNNPRTDRQMKHRLKFASRTALWAIMNGNLRGAFSRKAGNQSDFNIFMQLNSERGVYFTKQQSFKGAQVIFPVQISSGKLESIQYSITDGRVVTDIALGSLVINANTTVAALSAAIVAANSNFEYGDALSAITVIQSVNGEMIPKVRSQFYQLVLSRDDSRKVHDIVPAAWFQTVSGFLGTDNELPAGCYGYVLSRNSSGLKLSSQTLVSNNDEMIEAYSSDAQYELARNSYGTKKDSFLDPGSTMPVDDNQVVPEPEPVPELKTLHVSIDPDSPEECKIKIGDRAESCDDSVTVPEGSSIAIKAIPGEGWEFDGWDDGNSDAERIVEVNSSKWITAIFVEA